MVLRCTQTLFIFDEAEKLHSGLINAIKPYMDHYDNVDGVNYRGAIFLFLRSVGLKNKSRALRASDGIYLMTLEIQCTGCPRVALKVTEVIDDPG